MANRASGGFLPSQEANLVEDDSQLDYVRKYAQEREKRIRQDGIGQYMDPGESDHFKAMVEDPWVDVGTPINLPFPDGGHCKVAIIGAGFAGILNAVKLIKAGFRVTELLMIDPAGGFGGTWYFNRYPGLMCDVESYIYMPLLEEMDYMPTRKYASGNEIRLYAEKIAKKFNLHYQAMFQSTAKKVTWDPVKEAWDIQILQKPKGGTECNVNVHADFVIFGTGIFNGAKLPDIKGTEQFQGKMFHTARWAYDITGGSPTDSQLTKLEGKKVAFVGTGATAIQSVPQLAQWAEKLYVFQRTPSSVDFRNNRDTDVTTWKTQIASKPGWQHERSKNFNSFISNADPRPDVDLVDDGWTHMPSISAITGSPKTFTMETLAEDLGKLHQIDLVRQDKLRKRALETVKDSVTAKGLQAWYPGWCKRPCFHDEYLQAFNKPNVILVDTAGKGVDSVTRRGVKCNDKEYEIDVLIWGTGYPSPAVGSLAWKAGVEVYGKGGERLEDVFDDGRLDTLHGVVSRGFPNLFWTSHMQGGVTGNYTYVLDISSSHITYIITQATQKVGPKPLIQPTSEGQEQWAQRVMAGALAYAGVVGCTPNYFNQEGAIDQMTPEQQMKISRYGTWGGGMNDFVTVLEKWRADNKLEGLEVTAAA